MSLQLPESQLNSYWNDVTAALQSGEAIRQQLDGGEGVDLVDGMESSVSVSNGNGPSEAWNLCVADASSHETAVNFDALASSKLDAEVVIPASHLSSEGLGEASVDVEAKVEQPAVVSGRSGQSGPGPS